MRIRTRVVAMTCAFALATHGQASAEPANANWTGFYVGAHGGYGWEHLYDAEKVRADANGGLGGVHGGYLWQWQNLVAGIEGDFSWSRLSWSEANTAPGETGGVELTTDWLASLRGRLGYDLGPVLLYGTAGVAWTEWSLKGSYQVIATGHTDRISGGSTGTGWVAGGGAEMKLTETIIARIEGLHYRFDDLDTNFKINGVPVHHDEGPLDGKITVVRGGLTWRFN